MEKRDKKMEQDELAPDLVKRTIGKVKDHGRGDILIGRSFLR